jgi:hypothetical protein
MGYGSSGRLCMAIGVSLWPELVIMQAALTGDVLDVRLQGDGDDQLNAR